MGIAGTPYAMTRADLLSGNVDLLARCVALLRQQTPSNLSAVVDKPGKKVTLTAQVWTVSTCSSTGAPPAAPRSRTARQLSSPSRQAASRLKQLVSACTSFGNGDALF